MPVANTRASICLYLTRPDQPDGRKMSAADKGVRRCASWVTVGWTAGRSLEGVPTGRGVFGVEAAR